MDTRGRQTSVYESISPGGLMKLEGRFVTVAGRRAYLRETFHPLERFGHLPQTMDFIGEFGEELNHFIPYVHWLYKQGAFSGDRQIVTYPGMGPFYFFLEPRQIIFHTEARHFVPPGTTPGHYLHQSGLSARKSGLEWAPDYRAEYFTDFGYSKPLLIIHNKYTIEWRGSPVNFFEVDFLRFIFENLQKNFAVVFIGAAQVGMKEFGFSFDHQASLPYNDDSIAKEFKSVVKFEDLLAESKIEYNLLKLRLFASAHHFITVQGGNAHMCALFAGSLVAIQHVRGREEQHAYHNGTFQFLANPRPKFLIGRTEADMRQITGAFEDTALVDGQVHFGPRGLEIYRRYNPHAWRFVSVEPPG